MYGFWGDLGREGLAAESGSERHAWSLSCFPATGLLFCCLFETGVRDAKCRDRTSVRTRKSRSTSDLFVMRYGICDGLLSE